MPTRDRDRKILWGRSGSRCALCRRELIFAGAGSLSVSVVGQEAHIVPRSAGGPRGGITTHRDDLDAYGNLILLCSEHHKVVDDHPERYPADQLRAIKAQHELWVSQALSLDALSRAPHVLPEGAPYRFLNRRRELKTLGDILTMATASNVPMVALLTGIGGVGKSALGAYWTQSNWQQFEGQLYADLSQRRNRGMVDVSDVTRGFLHELGVSDEAIPPTLDSRRRLYRDLTRDKKLLVFLDDVSHPAHVSTLVPAGSGSLVLATSNRYLEELVRDGALVVSIDALDVDAARHFLVELLGAERISAESAAVDRLLEICGGLPIALCVCSARLLGPDRGRPIRSLVDAIEASPRPLRSLGTDERSIGAILDFAYAALTQQQATLYRRLGLYPGRDFTLPVAAAVADMHSEAANELLRELVECYLVEPRGDARYAMHALVRQHASECARVDETLIEQRAVLRRSIDWTYGAVRNADHAMVPDRLRLSDTVVLPDQRVRTFASRAEALQWLRVETANLLEVVRSALEAEFYDRAWQIAEALWPYCYDYKAYDLWLGIYDAGVKAACALADKAAEARLRSGLARAYSDHADFGRAAAEMRQAKAAAALCENPMLKASITEFDAIMHFERGEPADALTIFTTSRAMFIECGALRGVAIQDYQIAKCLIRIGGFERALEALDAARAALEQVHDEVTLTRVLRRRGEACLGLSRFADAASAFNESLDVASRLDLKLDQAEASEGLAAAQEARSEKLLATQSRQRAYNLYRELGHARADVLFNALAGADAS